MHSKVFASESLHAREVKLRDGDSLNVYLQEMSEAQVRARSNQIMDASGNKGNANRSFRLDKQRLYDFIVSIKDWDFVYEDGTKLEINEKSFNKLAGYIGNQINDHITELNGLPEDTPEERNQAGEVVNEAVENPT